MIRLRGRPRREWVATTKGYSFGAVIRLDDSADPEFWQEIELTSSGIRELLKQFLDASMDEMERNLSFEEWVVKRWQIMLELLKPIMLATPPEDTPGG